MKKTFKLFCYIIITSILTGSMPVTYAGNNNYDIMIFAAQSRVIIKDGEKLQTEYEPYFNNGVYLPAELVSEFTQPTGNDVNADDLRNMGFEVYESVRYGFLAVGNISQMNSENDENIIKQFGIYISAGGNDSNSGYPSSPVKSFERARELYREYREGDVNYNGKIFVHAGIYRRDESFTLNSADTGMTIEAYGDGEVLIKGSVKLPRSSFRKVTDTDFLQKVPQNAVDKIYEIDLSDYLNSIIRHPEYNPLHGGTAYYELFVGGVAQTIARWPNYDFALTGNVSGGGLTFESDSKRLEKWKNSKDAMVAGYWTHNWAFEHIYIGDVDVDNSTVTLSKQLQYSDGIVKSQRYYAMNMPEEMDIPGEYYIDSDAKKLYYYPAESFLENDPELSVLTSTMFVTNGADNVTISGLTFEYTRGNAISCDNGDNIVIDSCVIRNIGNQAISVNTSNSTVKNCEIYNVGGAGIYMTSGTQSTLTPGNGKIINNNIYNFGRIFRTYQSAINISGVGNTASYNTIHDAPHSGIRFGGNDNVISHNEIYNVVIECSDSGAIYTGRNWTSWGNEISYNYMHDIKKDEELTSFTVSAVYIDDMFCGTTVKNNVFENCTQAALFGGGKGNVFSDNILIDCDNGIDYDDRAVTGNWAHYYVISGGSVYEGIKNLLSDPNVDIELWKSKYPGFSQMIEDIYAYQADPSYETGYPKNVTITGNINYGENTQNSNYDYISPYVYEYGTVADNTYTTEYGQVNIPQSGASDTLWNSEWTVFSPASGRLYDTGEIEFVWSRNGGAEKYEVTITDSKGEEILKDTTLKNGYNITIGKKGVYNWTVTAYRGQEQKSINGSFEILKDIEISQSYFGGTDFENVDLKQLREQFGWSFKISDGDSISVKQDENGNSYLEMIRNEANLWSGSETYAKMDFTPKTQGKITVTYDIMLENFRAGFRDMGSVQSRSGQDVMRLFTHMLWLYAMGTDSGKYNFQLSNQPNNQYLTVKRVIDLDNDTYSMDIYREGVRIGHAGSYQCNDAEAGSLMFRLAYLNPFEPAGGTGNAVYRIDNISVDMGELAVAYTYPENKEDDVSVDSEINIKLNTKADAQSVNYNTVSVYENERQLSADEYSVNVQNNDIVINILEGMKESSQYRVVLSKNILPDSFTHGEMSVDYSFSFNTKKQENYIYTAECFEEYETGTLPQNTDWSFSVAQGDSMSIEEDIYGNKALKIIRAAENLESKSQTYAKLNINKEIQRQPITASFDLRIENYRGGIKNLGSLGASNGIIASLFTHSAWMYGVSTSGYNTYLSTMPNNVYLTIKREIDTVNGTYSIWVYRDGTLISTSQNRQCNTADAEYILFETAYQEPYKIYGDTGDAVYWIDNIRIDSGNMGVYKVIPEDNSESESIDSIKMYFNCDINPDTVNANTLKIYKYSLPLSENQYSVTVTGNILKIDFNSPVDNGADCTVQVTKEILPKNSNAVNSMGKDYTFNFKTLYDSNENVVASYDFEDWDGFSLNQPGVYHHNGWTFELSEGDSISVETDSKTGNKGLKLTKGTDESLLKAYLDYEVSGDELIKISYDTRFERQSRRIHDWGTALNQNNSPFLKMVVFGGGYWHRTIGDTKRYLCGLNENVTTTEQILNAAVNEYTVSVYRNGEKITEKSENASNNGLPSEIMFSVSNIRDNYAGEDTGNGIYWIDNVTVTEILTPKVADITSDNLNTAKIIFNKNIDTESVSRSNIKVYDNGVLINAYTTECLNQKEISVNFSNTMTEGHTYTFVVDGIVSETGSTMIEKETYTIECTKIFDVTNVKDVNGNVEFEVKSNISEYVCIAVLKDVLGKIVDITVLDGQKTNILEYSYDAETGTPEFYFWRSLENMNPLTPKISSQK